MFLVCFMALFCGTVMAQEVALDFTTNGWNLPEGKENKLTELKNFSNGVYTIQLQATDGYYFHASGYLMLGKSGSSLTLPAFDFEVEKIEVTGSSGASAAVKQNIYVGETAVSTETTGAKDVTNIYEIAADYQAAGNVYILKVNSAHNTQITKILIYKKGGGGSSTTTVPTPTISGETKFSVTTEVTISVPDGGSTYYTLDNSTPSKTNGTAYTVPFTLDKTTTVKAISYDEDDNASSVAEKTFTKEDAIKVANIKEFNALAENTVAELTLTNAQVLYVNDYNGKEIFVRDATGAIDLYKLGIEAKAGDVLNGTISGKRSKNSGFTMAMKIDNSTDPSTVTVTSGSEAAPIDIVIANANDNICDYGVIKDVTIEANGTNKTAVIGADKLPLYDRFKLNLTNDLKTDGSTYNIYGLLYDGGTQYGIELVVTKVELVKEGTPAEPQNVSVAEALEIVNALEDNKTTNEQYKVTGFVVGAPDFQRNTEGALYGNVNFYIADEKGGSNTLYVFRAKDLENVAFTEETINNLKEGDEVVVLGNLQKFVKNETTTLELTNGYLISIKSSGETPATPEMIAFTDGDTAGDGVVFSKGEFKLTQVDKDAKTAIDGNSTYFGTADNYQKFTHRLKTGGKSSSKNSLTLTIPSDGTLNVYVRTGSNSATDRNLVLTQDGTELYNKVVQESDAITVTMGEKDNNVYPVISVEVKAGELAVGYPTGSLNFYGFEFIAGTNGVNAVTVEKAKNNIRYNLAGQRVDESYKGVVIMNGKKFVVK